LDLAAFDEGPIIGQSDGGSPQIYRRRARVVLPVVKSIYPRPS
jgi:hypothetical protein